MDIKKTLTLILLVLIAATVFGFGKNKIHYKTFDWFIKESEHFKVYYYNADEVRLLEIVEMLESAYKNHSEYLQVQLKDKAPVILYETHRDFEQTNIISGFLPPQVEGFSELLMNRLVVPIDSPNDELEALIWHELTHIFQYRIFRSSILTKEPPMWFMEGLAEHMSNRWDMKGEMVLRDAIMNNHFYTLQQMEHFYYTPNVYQCYKESQSFIDWFVETYGVDKLRKMIRYLRRPGQFNLNQVFKKTVGLSYRQINDKWYGDLKKKYWPTIKELESPDIDYSPPIFEDMFYDETWLQPVFFPSGATLAGITTKNGKLDIYIFSREDQESKKDNKYHEKVIKRLTPMTTNAFEYLIVEENSLNISRDGRKLAVFARDGKSDVLLIFNIFNKSFKKIRFESVLKPRHPFFMDSDSIFFTGEQDGGREVFFYDIESGGLEKITDKKGFINFVNYDHNTGLLYYSRRVSGLDKLFSYDLSNDEETQLTFGLGNDVEPSLSHDGTRIVFTSDRVHDIPNLFIYDNKTRLSTQITNTLGGNFMAAFSPDGKDIAFTSFYDGAYKTYVKPISALGEFSKFNETPPEEIEKPTTEEFPNVSFLKNVKKYNLQLKATNVSSYITYENGILENYSNITLSDMLGDLRIEINIDAIRQFNNFYAYVFMQRYRLNWGVVIFNQREDYYFWDPDSFGSKGQYGAALIGIYPLSKYRRLEAEVQYGLNYWDILFQNLYGFPAEKRVLATTLTFISDTTTPGFFSYNGGNRFLLSFSRGFPLSENYYDVMNVRADFMKYWKLTFRSTMAFRFFGYSSFGADKDYIYLGGIGSIRGYYPMSIYGNNAFFANLELRIPFIDIIRFAGLFDLYYIRGLFFVDVGDAWLGDSFHGISEENGQYRFDDLQGSLGFGIRFRWGYFDLMFDFAKRWDLYKVYPKTYFQFNIGSDF